MPRPDGGGARFFTHRTDVQGLRALAVLLVVAFHTGHGVHGGFIGVDVFFVISGFVIGLSLLGELGREDRIDFRRFYLRRARRLLPALGLMLAIVMLASVYLAPSGAGSVTWKTGLSAALFNANTYLARAKLDYYSPAAERNPLLHTWSLSVEEQFYFVFPLIVANTKHRVPKVRPGIARTPRFGPGRHRVHRRI